MKAEDTSDEDLVRLISERKLQLHEVDKHAEPSDAARIRRQGLELLSSTKLERIGSADLDYRSLVNRNAENVIGGVTIPMGVAGPLKINGGYAKGEFYVPMATTEGALVASANRGMKAITLSGGAKAVVLKNAMARAPLFELDSVSDVKDFLEWVPLHFENIKKRADECSEHCRLIEAVPFVTGNNVWLRFSFDTGDAMGMNMVTIASDASCSYIEREFGKARCVALTGNMCSDKKESFVNSLMGRGKSVVAEALINKEALAGVLKTTAEKLNNINIKKNLLGSARAGSTKYNAHYANIVSAIFAATGQDLAQVVESSSGYTWTEVRENGLYISATLPSLEIGTVGGGTALPAQMEALSLLGVAGSGKPIGSNALKFAEIIASAVLAGELNLLAALSSGDLGKAHQRLGRGGAGH